MISKMIDDKLKGGVEMADQKGVPTGVKIISVFYYIGTALLLLLGLAAIFGAGAFASMLSQIGPLAALGSGMFMIMGIIAIGFSVLFFFIGKGLWNGKSWSRIVAIVLAALSILNGIYSIATGMGGWVGLVIQIVIGLYLLLNKEVKEAFN